MKRNVFVAFVALLISFVALAQKIDHTSAITSIDSDRYFRFSYDNDYFAATDFNYTQGYSFELVLPIFKKNPLNALFFLQNLHVGEAGETKKRYGLAIEHIGFTPYRYESEDIQFGDRPFAAAIMLKSFAIRKNTQKKYLLTSSLSLGLIGPGAFGKEMQVAIHKATDNEIPRGWKHQIRNDAVIQYDVQYEKALYRYGNTFAVNMLANAQMGTLFTNGSVGVNLRLGWINNEFSSEPAMPAGRENQKTSFYLFAQSRFKAVGYDATLQGGLFNRKSVYTISDRDITRLTGQYQYGVTLQTPRWYVTYHLAGITREFNSGQAAGWGGVRFGYIL